MYPNSKLVEILEKIASQNTPQSYKEAQNLSDYAAFILKTSPETTSSNNDTELASLMLDYRVHYIKLVQNVQDYQNFLQNGGDLEDILQSLVFPVEFELQTRVNKRAVLSTQKLHELGVLHISQFPK